MFKLHTKDKTVPSFSRHAEILGKAIRKCADHKLEEFKSRTLGDIFRKAMNCTQVCCICAGEIHCDIYIKEVKTQAGTIVWKNTEVWNQAAKPSRGATITDKQ